MPCNIVFRPIFALALLAFIPLRAGLCEAAPALLTVVPDAHVLAAAPGQAQTDVGSVDPAVQAQATQTFHLKNATGGPITISRLRASCGCETLLLTKAGRAVPTTILAPGEQAEVKMSVRLAGQHSGRLEKFAWVYGPQGDPALATLVMALTIRQAVSFSPDFLDFGTVAGQTTHVRPLTVTVDRSAVPPGGLPPLTDEDGEIRAAPQGSPQPTLRDGKLSVRQDYLVTLTAPPQSGRVSGRLRFATPPQGGNLLSNVFEPLGGTVTGDLLASPKTVYFGSVILGRAATRQVLISVSAQKAGSALTVSSSSVWLSPSLSASGGSPRLLTVVLKAGAPSGPLQAQITVVSDKGDRVTVPVVAEIVRPGSPE